MKRISALLVILFLFGVTAWGAQERAYAPEGPGDSRSGPGGPGGHGFGPDGPGGKHLIKALERLNLSPEQKRAVAGVLKNNREAAKKDFESLKQSMEALHEVMDKTPGNEAAVRAACKPVAAAGEALALHHAKVKVQIDAVLTPEQRVQAQKEREEFKGKMKNRFEKGHADLDKWIDDNSK